MKSPVVSNVMAQVTCPAAFQSRSLKIHNNPNTKAKAERPKTSRNLPKVNNAMTIPGKMMAASQTTDRVESLCRKREPTASVTSRLSANQMAERYNKRVSMRFV